MAASIMCTSLRRSAHAQLTFRFRLLLKKHRVDPEAHVEHKLGVGGGGRRRGDILDLIVAYTESCLDVLYYAINNGESV